MTAQDSDREAQEFIDSKLQSVLKDFVAEARQKESLCECNDIDFTLGRLPSYDNRLAQRFYLLKYMPAYMAEYHWLYTNALEVRGWRGEELSVLSLGCGCGLDLWSLYFVLKAKCDPRACLRYTGLDKVEWADADNLKLPGADLQWRDVREAIGSVDGVLKYDMIVFPRSLSDFDDQTFKSIKEAHKGATDKRNPIIILAALSPRTWPSEDKRLKQLGEVLEYHGFQLDAVKGRHYDGEGKCAGKLWSAFSHKRLEEVTNIRQHCETYKRDGESGCRELHKRRRQGRVKCQLARATPILTTKYTHLRVCKFVRRPTADSR